MTSDERYSFDELRKEMGRGFESVLGEIKKLADRVDSLEQTRDIQTGMQRERERVRARNATWWDNRWKSLGAAAAAASAITYFAVNAWHL